MNPYIKSALILEAWEDDSAVGGDDIDDFIDNFMIPMPGTLSPFRQTYALTVEGVNGIANLTLTYHNLTTDPSPCNSYSEIGKS